MKLSRRLPHGFEKQVRKYALHTGLASWAWTRVHGQLFLMFWFAMSSKGEIDAMHPTAHSIWHQIQNDSTQREMLISVVRTRLFDQKQLVANVEWLIKTLNRLSTYRNILVHTEAIFSPYMRQAPAASPAGARTGARQRFDNITHDKFWRDLAGDLNALTSYSFSLSTIMQTLSPQRSSLRKPKLLSLAQIDRIEGQISRLAQSKAHFRQQSSSLAKPMKRPNARASQRGSPLRRPVQ